MIDQFIATPWFLSFVTLAAVVGVGVYQLKRNRGSQHKRGERPGGIAGPE